jgi:hypothetical protein
MPHIFWQGGQTGIPDRFSIISRFLYPIQGRVGIKETEDPVSLCYCFGWTKKKIDDEIVRTGTCKAVEDIMNRMKTTGCNCERNNPSGGCCLKDVTQYLTVAQERIGQK